jgi:hypothetical protein
MTTFDETTQTFNWGSSTPLRFIVSLTSIQNETYLTRSLEYDSPRIYITSHTKQRSSRFFFILITFIANFCFLWQAPNPAGLQVVQDVLQRFGAFVYVSFKKIIIMFSFNLFFLVAAKGGSDGGKS